jgi:hypothetical protein
MEPKISAFAKGEAGRSISNNSRRRDGCFLDYFSVPAKIIVTSTGRSYSHFSGDRQILLTIFM